MRLTEALRSLGSRPRRLPAPVGPVSVTDGGSALRIVESMLSSRTPDTASGSTPRETLAGALGLAFTGVRTAVHLDGAELLRGQDLWTRACGAHLPLVVHLECRAPETHAASAGSGHEAIHAAEDGVVLVARNVQEAIDLTLLAHRISESALVPALVACDGPETYRALQDVRLPEPHVTKTFVGGPADRIPAPTPAQELLFGTARRRVPRWYDLDRPAALGGEQDAQGWALGAAGNRPFFHEAVPELLEKASTELAGLTGRPVDPISTHATQGAQVVVIAMGAAVETAEAVADHLRETEKLKVGVLGIRCLRPFPEAQIVAALRGVEHAVVLERVDAPLSVDPPLARTIRACLGRAQQRQRQGTPGPAGKDKDFPNVRPVAYGLGSLPLRAADLAELLRRLPELAAERRYLGLDFVARSAQNPKRQVLLDRLQREYPGLVHLGITAPVPLELEPAGIFTVALPDNDPDLVR
ncbi:MAG: hypothetical protein KC729_01320, partial [Candidatus Eisenbacteria bacterium]|nr:hypothetical protein [Candidatus Eisenbacteria bacterium]